MWSVLHRILLGCVLGTVEGLSMIVDVTVEIGKEIEGRGVWREDLVSAHPNVRLPGTCTEGRMALEYDPPAFQEKTVEKVMFGLLSGPVCIFVNDPRVFFQFMYMSPFAIRLI